MTRQIKFRAWIGKRNCWADEVEVYSDGSWSATIGNISGYGEEDDGHLVQSTGLLDKNGKDIYGGYILKNSRNTVVQVKWNQGRQGWSVYYPDDQGSDYFENHDELEIIGNIYENPELLNNL